VAKLKYLSCCFNLNEGMKAALQEIPRRGGYYNWIHLFKGSIKPFKYVENFEDYDVVSVNMSPMDQHLIKRVRDKIPKSSSTLLVLNNDYVTECWSNWSQHPYNYIDLQDKGDCVFGTEKHQTSCMKEGAYTIPHPHWIEGYKKYKPDYDNDDMDVAALYHWWHPKTYHMSLIFDKLKKKFPKLYTKLYAFQPGTSKDSWLRTEFDEIKPMMQYPDFINDVTKNRFMFDNCPYHTYGRASVDNAAFGLPSVGTNRVDSMRRCFPFTTHDPYDAKGIVESMTKLIEDKEFTQKVNDFARDACEYYNYKNSEDRYMEMIESTRDRLKK